MLQSPKKPLLVRYWKIKGSIGLVGKVPVAATGSGFRIRGGLWERRELKGRTLFRWINIAQMDKSG